MNVRKIFFGTFILAALMPVTVGANDIDTLETVTVTGELQSKTLQETQTSTWISSGSELEQSGSEDLFDVVDRIPNINAVFGDKGYAIRGVTQYGVGGGSDDGTNGLINISIDGAALPTIISGIYGPESTWDIEQVEVLRGAQSTQQGRNALAGAIHIRTADPVFNEETRLRASGGMDGYKGFAIAHNTPLSDTLAFRLAAEHSESNGYVDNQTRNDDHYDARSFDNLRAKLKFDSGDNLIVTGGINVARRSAGSDLIAADEFPDRRVSFSDAEADQSSTHQILHLNATYFLTDTLWLESITSYYRHQFDREEDTDYSASEGNLFLLDTRDNSVSQDLRLGFDNGTGTSAVAGIFFTRIGNDYDQDVTLPLNRVIALDNLAGNIPSAIQALLDQLPFDVDSMLDFVANEWITLNPIQQTERRTTNSAFYAELDHRFDASWSASLGFRYDNEDIRYDSYAETTLFAKPLPQLRVEYLPPSQGTGDTRFSAFLPKAGVRYDIDPRQSVGFTVQKAYRAGGVQRNPVTLRQNAFDPEYTFNYELAYRSQWFDQALAFNGNLFYTDWDDMQVPVYGDSGNQYDFDTVNAGTARLYGLELDVMARVTPKVKTRLGVGYVETEFTDFSSGGTDLTGNEFAFAPPLSGSLGVIWQSSPALRWQAEAAYQDSHFNSVTNAADGHLPSRTVLNASVTWQQRNWSLALITKNMLDRQYATQYFDDNTQRLARAGDPRYVGVQLTLEPGA